MTDQEFIKSIASIPNVVDYLQQKSTELSRECSTAIYEENINIGKEKSILSNFYNDLAENVSYFFNENENNS